MADERIKEIVKAYGYDAQSRQCIEEMAELTQAINKFWRKDLMCGLEEKNFFERHFSDKYTRISETHDNLLEEIADVEIMLEQMKVMLHCEGTIRTMINDKLERQIARIRKSKKESEKMSSTEAMQRLEMYRWGAQQNENTQYDEKLHNACIEALKEKAERDGENDKTGNIEKSGEIAGADGKQQ